MANVLAINADVFEQQKNQPGVLVVDFWATWCMPCKMTAPLLEKLAEDYDGKITVAKIDVDEEPALADSLGIESIPFVAFFKNGQLSSSLVGLQDYATYTHIVDELL